MSELSGDRDDHGWMNRVLVRYQPWLPDSSEFLILYKTVGVDYNQSAQIAAWLRWYSDADDILIWETRRYVFKFHEVCDWQPVVFDAPIPPRGSRFLRFEIIAEEGGGTRVPVCVGFVQRRRTDAATSGAIVPENGVLGLTPIRDNPNGFQNALSAGINPNLAPAPMFLAAHRLAANECGLLVIRIDQLALDSLHFLQWPAVGGRPLMIATGARSIGAEFAVIPEIGLTACDAAILGRARTGQRPARIHVVEGTGDPYTVRSLRNNSRRRDRRVSVVVTSCGRQDLLDRTLESFFTCNDYPIGQFIVVEDGVETANRSLVEKYADRKITWLATGARLGQIAAIDYAYSFVDSPYIFHLEDDWEFIAAGFISKSLVILEAVSDCLQVWIRALYDMNHHPTDQRVDIVAGISIKRLLPGYLGKWFGFSFNPGLRRTADYDRIGMYGWHTHYQFGNPTDAEATLSQVYHRFGYHAVVLADNEGNGYVRHAGFGRRVPGLKTLS